MSKRYVYDEDAKIKQLQAELANAKKTIERAASCIGVEGYGCPLCKYDNGRFVALCSMHEQLAEAKTENEHLCNVVEATRQDMADYLAGTLEGNLQDKVKQLRKALEQYGEHCASCGKDKRGYCTERPDTEVMRDWEAEGCTCGFEQALKDEPKRPGPLTYDNRGNII